MRRSPRLSCAALALLLLAAALFLLPAIDWGMPNPRDPAIDNLVIHGGWAYDGENLAEEGGCVYPPLHFHLLEIVFKPIRSAVGSGAAPDEVAPWFVIAGRALSAVMALAAAAAIFFTGRATRGTAAGLIAAFLFLTSPAVAYYGRSSNADLPYVAWFALALAAYHRVLLSPAERARGAVFFFVLAAAAVATKDQSAALFPLLALHLAWRLRGRGLRYAGAGLAAGGALYAASYLPLGGWDYFRRHVAAMAARSEHFVTHEVSPGSQLDLAGLVASDLFATFGPLLLFLAAAGLFLLLWQRRADAPRALLLVSIPYLAALFLFARRSNARYLLPFLPLLALAAGHALSELLRPTGWRRRAGIAALFLALAHSASGSLAMTRLLADLPVPRSKEHLRQRLGEGSILPRSRIGVFSVREGVQFAQDESGRWAERPALRDWTELDYGPVDPALPVSGLLADPASLYLASPRVLAFLPERAPETPWISDLLAGRLGYRESARFERATSPGFDLSRIFDPPTVILLVLEGQEGPEDPLLALAARSDRAGQAEFVFAALPEDVRSDPAVVRRRIRLVEAISRLEREELDPNKGGR
ncbi:MAG: glycosyltransferase family 39 protein [Planctomycetes bacterium]|nr:glycosyltransferase family 39 protein [Planctomycetota bacterium]